MSTISDKSALESILKRNNYSVLERFIWFNIVSMRMRHISFTYMFKVASWYLNLVGYMMSKTLHTTLPREQDGRDSFERYRAQVRSASIAALTILEGTEVDRIYCDLHDDFVKRKVDGGGYEFFQVKTKSKQNHNWKLNEVFGIKSRGNEQSSESIKNSFVGKLLLHTVIFGENCDAVVFQTNINNEDNIEKIINDIESGNFSNKYTSVLLKHFNDCICYDEPLNEDEIKEKLKKLKFETDVQYLKSKNNNYEAIVRQAIYDYSEVDLTYNDNQEIIMKLLDLVSKKSSGRIENWSMDSIEENAGISIDDLLSILSISKDAYQYLKDGGDRSAIKNISIIQRLLKNVGANDDMIEYCSKSKLDWDLWYRGARHSVFKLDLDYIVSQVKNLLEDNLFSHGGNINTMSLRAPIKKLISDLKDENMLYDLDENLILGGIFAEVVRRKS
ncbi:dsDNA nuclease domain-containing protein [Vibrio splendidus]